MCHFSENTISHLTALFGSATVIGKREVREPMSKQTYVRMSLYYLLFYTSIGVFKPYFNLFLSSRGLSGQQVGMVLAVIPLVGIMVQPLWGVVNDRFHIQKTTLFVGLLISSAVLLAFPHLHTLSLYLVGAAFISMFQSAMIPITDSMTVQTAGTRHYGRVRLFGSLGYACAAAIAVIFFNDFGVVTLPLLYLGAAFLTLFGLWAYPKPPKPSRKSDSSPFAGTGELLRNRRFLLILGFTLLVTISQAVNNNFFSLYYKELGRPMVWLGTIYAFGALSELPFFFVIGYFIEKYGAERIFLLGGGIFLLRWVVLCFEPPTWLIAVMQLSHGLSFSLTFAAGVSLAAAASNADNRVTAQTLYSSVNVGLSAIVGSLVGGVMLGSSGPRGIYVFASIICFIGLCAMAQLIRKERKSVGTGTGTSLHT